MVGDVNNDGRLTSLDAEFVARLVVNPDTLIFNGVRLYRDAADVNNDGVLMMGDATHLLQSILGYNVQMYRLNMNYRILVNSAGGQSAERRAIEIMDGVGTTKGVETIFREEFNINLIRQSSGISSALNMKSGCLVSGNNAICMLPERNPNPPPANLPGCGTSLTGTDCRDRHHRSASYFVRQESLNTINTFRFVNYRLCAEATSTQPHEEVEGLAESVSSGNRINMVVSLAISDSNQRQTTAHEISHLLGIRGHDCDASYSCVMAVPLHLRAVDSWCPRHRAIILDGLR